MAEILSLKIPLLKKGYHRMTLPFGNQKLQGKDYLHKGVDFSGNPNVSGGYDDILAFAGGTVITAGFEKDCGYWVRIDHGNGVISRYMHMKKGSLKVKVGNKVKKGQIIGSMGATGNVTGRHLHFDISFNGDVTSTHGGFYVEKQNRTYVDPIPYLMGEKTITDVAGYTIGNYKVVKAVNIRKGPGTNYDRVFYSSFSLNAKLQVKKLGGKPEDNDFSKGMKLSISKIEQDKHGNWWGKCPTGWVYMKGYLEKV